MLLQKYCLIFWLVSLFHSGCLQVADHHQTDSHVNVFFKDTFKSTEIAASQNVEDPTPVYPNLTHAAGYCVMYDECGINTQNQKKVNCLYNGKARHLRNATGLQLLLEICPYLYKGDNTTTTCCSTNQLITMQDSLKIAFQYLSRCPSCLRNFYALYCEMTCSPNQSFFTDIVHAQKGDSALYHPYEPNVTYVSETRCNITNQFAKGFFKSCQHVNNPSTNAPAIELMCGPNANKCNGQRWISYLNNIENSQAPYQIDALWVDDPNAGLNYTTDHCNNVSYTGEAACSCNDCPASCSTAAVPEPPEPWKIWGIDAYFIIMTFVYFGFVVLFLNLLVWMLTYRKNSRTCHDSKDFCVSSDSSSISSVEDDLGIHAVVKPTTDDAEVGAVERCGHFMENLLRSTFQSWGTFCAKHPLPVLLIGGIAIIVCAVGLNFMEITTDPVQLWSAPTSQARLNKKYFDQHFGPFFRTEQLIITAPGSNWSVYHPYQEQSNAPVRNVTFGSILQKEVLMEILKLQLAIESITAEHNNETVTLSDICLKPLAPDNNNCTITSVLNYFQNDRRVLNESYSDGFTNIHYDYHDHLIACLSGPTTIDDMTELHLSCLGTYGGPIFPWVALGGFPGKNYLNSSAAVITFPVINYYNNPEKLNKALAWEKKYVEFMKSYTANYTGSSSKRFNLSIAFSSERSIEDEINRESSADVMTIIFSYLIMFAYVSIALGRFGNCGRIMIDCQLTVGLFGVFMVLCSVAMSLGVFSYAGIPLTLIIVEVVPFLALAVGVDNIFILVQHYQRDEKRNSETNEEQLGRVLGEVAPSMFLSSLSETVAFFLGGLSTMPAVRTFSMFAGLAVFCDFLLQITCFVAVLALDSRRQAAKRYDCLCCIKSNTISPPEKEGLLYSIFKNYVAPVLLCEYIRHWIIIIFVGMLCFSGGVLHKIDIGLDQALSMPEDSYVLTYFDSMKKYLSVGAPVYFVVPEGYNYTSQEGADMICGGSGCSNNSLIQQISRASNMANYSHIAYPATSWLDDYFDWLKPQSACCRYSGTVVNPQFCPATVKTGHCTLCRSYLEDHDHPRPDSKEFMQFLPWFLKDNPEINCGKGGHAAYGSAVNILGNGTSATVGATYFMGYHTISKTSTDFIQCLKHANSLSAGISQALNVDVFPYSVFYVYYEQYLTIVHDTLLNLGVSVAAIFGIIFFSLGCDILSAVIAVGTILMIIVDMFGCMYLWSIPLNAVSLVNLVMAVGISVEFCAHVTRAFAMSQSHTRVGRAKEALAEMGSSVFSGITLTKFVGIVVLAFSKSQIFKVFYFRMYLCVVLLGATHGLIFLPVLLSYIGPRRRSLYQNHQSMREEAAGTSNVEVVEADDLTSRFARGDTSDQTRALLT